jgi:tripartite ATP-independent transporter DctM subunit
MIAISLMILIYIFSAKRNYPKGKFSLKELLTAYKGAFLSTLAPIIIMVGMFTGYITPTEAAAVAVIYAFFLSFILYRDVSLKKLYKTILDASVSTATITIILGAAAAFSWIIAIEGIPQALTAQLLSLTQNPLVILLLLNIALLVIGMFMESLSLLTILVPFLIPIVAGTAIDPVHMGIVVVLNLMIGLVTPPAGICLFVVSKYKGVRLEKLYKEILPFLIPLIIVLLIVTYFPAIVLWLPRMFFGY